MPHKHPRATTGDIAQTLRKKARKDTASPASTSGREQTTNHSNNQDTVTEDFARLRNYLECNRQKLQKLQQADLPQTVKQQASKLISEITTALLETKKNQAAWETNEAAIAALENELEHHRPATSGVTKQPLPYNLRPRQR